jgi:hypothetical protein
LPTLAGRYLMVTRGLDLSAFKDDGEVLRFHASCPHGGQRHPSLLMLHRDVATDRPAGIHRVALTPDARKVGRMLLGKWPAPRAVKLHNAADELMVGEGLETVLAAIPMFKKPAWSLSTAGALAKFPIVDAVRRLIILVDHDDVGQTAAKACARRWREAGRTVDLVMPAQPGFDFNDLARGPGNGFVFIDKVAADKTEHDLDVIEVGQLLETMPPPRGWVYGVQLCRRFLSAVIGAGGVGKTALRVAQAVAMASGRDLLGDKIFFRARVLYLSLEDDITEMQRRVRAPMIHYGVNDADLDGFLFLSTTRGMKLAQVGKDRKPEAGALENAIRRAVERYKPDVLLIDPFIKSHGLQENDNEAMDFVCDLLAQLAIKLNIAVDILHHTRKGGMTAGDAEVARGASAIKDAARLAYTVTPMSEHEADVFGIKPEERRAYFRLDSAKVNIAPPSRDTRWFELVTVALGNANATYPEGDRAHTVKPWLPPALTAGLTVDLVNAILDDIDKGLPNGQRYSDGPNAGDRDVVGAVQATCSDKSPQQCRKIIAEWIKQRILVRREYHDPVRRHKAKGLYVERRPATVASEVPDAE